MDRISKEKRSLNMSKIRSADTSLELIVRRYLFGKGFRYRVRYSITGKPDIVFIKRKIAVFINGCFWHLHGCKLSRIPSTRRDFWYNKLIGNRDRDLKVNSKLRSEGWHVITLWECEIMEDLDRSLLPLIKGISSNDSK